jgi:thiaminase/transcriptional activator TenA
MTFLEEAIQAAMPLWRAAADEDFLTEMGNGTLDRAAFLDYIVQDSLYLRDYLKAYAMALFKSRTLRQMQTFYSVLGYVNDSENATRLAYLAEAGMTDDDVETVEKKPACAAYTDFLLQVAQEEDVPEILMAVLPCMLGYRYVFEELVRRFPAVLEGAYAPLVRDYTAPGYAAACDEWTAFGNALCASLPAERRAHLIDRFVQASAHELYFWQMAGGKPPRDPE